MFQGLFILKVLFFFPNLCFKACPKWHGSVSYGDLGYHLQSPRSVFLLGGWGRWEGPRPRLSPLGCRSLAHALPLGAAFPTCCSLASPILAHRPRLGPSLLSHMLPPGLDSLQPHLWLTKGQFCALTRALCSAPTFLLSFHPQW